MNISLLRKPKYLVSAILTVAIAGSLAYKFLTPPPAPSYLSAIAGVADIEDTVLASGTVKAYKQVSVGAQASGQIKSLKVALGEQVKKGQLVAEIDSLTQANSLRTAEYSLQNLQAQLRSKEATLKQAQLAYERQKTMLAGDASSRESFESAEATLNTTKADILALQAQINEGRISVDTARVNLGYTRISSPIDGQVVAIVAQEGQTVNANQSTPTIIKVARMDTVTVKAQISEADVVRVKPGQQVYFTILGAPDQRYSTTLRAIEPAPDSILQDDTSTTSTSSSSTSSSSSSTAIYYNGLLDVPNADGKLRISMTTQVNIVLSSAKGALVVPSTALGDKAADGSYTVRVLDEQGRAHARKVRIGINTNAQVQITEGLKAGERVVTGMATPGTTTASSSEHHGPPPMM
ncbi:efflux RND transporter periplasmic adaptor subunit [Herbaspirillum sp. LeCh32-8]|uniref:efflux RND transporter periplasmic adaptor subunit n=1 Tax=Herbaspirillum sp. LeCh32-8 TaxID=2821356 RepID=UPI001AE46EE0|nr:efflux RND transporter periplasmic adaptor subunit [Herbaspirillum sp. LeCh32-8]MBP0596965.1 efflux RND transporter periplasmic adaptor subunit [Herbaspirillum sp. LeCh32-8]